MLQEISANDISMKMTSSLSTISMKSLWWVVSWNRNASTTYCWFMGVGVYSTIKIHQKRNGKFMIMLRKSGGTMGTLPYWGYTHYTSMLQVVVCIFILCSVQKGKNTIWYHWQMTFWLYCKNVALRLENIVIMYRFSR